MNIKAWYGKAGALMTDRQVPGCDTPILDTEGSEFYGGPFMLAESMSKSTAKTIAEKLGLEWVEDINAALGVLPMKKYVTVVFEINDPTAWKAEFDKIHKKMVADESEPWRVTAMSLDDEMTRLELLEQASSMDDGLIIMADIFSSTDISGKTIGDFTDC